MTLRELTKKEKELIELINEYSSCYSKRKLNLFMIIKFDEITKESQESLATKFNEKTSNHHKELLDELIGENYN